MKKFLLIILVAIASMYSSCNKDYLNVSSPSSVDQDFVFSAPDEAYKSLVGCYEDWKGALYGMFYDTDMTGSDVECHPETYDSQLLRHVPEQLYATENPIDYYKFVDEWAALFKIANKANIIMEVIGKKADYLSAVAAGTPNVWTQLYGEAAIFRAYSYFYLIRYYGDVPYFQVPIYSLTQTTTATLTSRDVIYDGEIANLIKAEPLMYRLGQGGITAERFSRSFCQGMIGKIALYAGGYGLRRTDFDYGNVTFTQKGIVQWDAKYVRRTDYKDYYGIAKTYFEALLANPGTAYLITTDTRGAAFANPFQRNFQYNMDLVVSPESLYEVGFTRATGNSDYPYAFGRPSNGGGSNAFPCKSYGQSRIHASFYYGEYDPKDMRRDVTVAVTANSGSASEVLIDFKPGNCGTGGLANNKWDESRMANPYTQAQRTSGVNQVQLRMADVILMLAETYAELGDDAAAKTELTKIRSRAFKAADQATLVTAYISALSGDALKAAIQEERKFELAGEGIRRSDLIRTGTMPEAIKKRRDLQKAMVASLISQGYYTFANGNQISNFIYIKKVNVGDLGMTKMLTTECIVPETDPTWPVKFPGWRGNCDLWSANNFLPTAGNRNIAIQGMFRYINPAGAEATALVAAGYVKTKWGQSIVDYKDEYSVNIFKGYTDAYYAAGAPPRYMCPLSSETISKSNGLITNGYGFAQQ
jgi:hypothetical protein